MERITSIAQINFLLKKMAKENGFNLKNVFVNKAYKYIETVDNNQQGADFCQTIYNEVTYKVIYLSGCFNPYMVKY